MRLLLDTHVWIWSHLEPKYLSRKAPRALAAPGNQLWLSPVSLWEFYALVEKGRVLLQEGDSERWLDAAFQKAPLQEAPLTHAIVRAGRRLQLPHRDPADRFIAATAQVLNLTLVTADVRLLRTEQLRTLAAR